MKTFLRPVLSFALLIAVVVGCSTSSDDGPSLESLQVAAAKYQANCASCHGNPVTGEGRADGFALAPIHGPGGHTWHHADGQLLDIVQGRITYPDRIMPAFEGILSDADVIAVLDFLKLGWTEEQLASQQEVSANWDRARE